MHSKIGYKKIDFKFAREYLEGKNIVFTGRGFLVRGELMRLARQAGANVESLVTKKCDILIVGEKPGSKLRKAKVLGCEIISTDDFKDILEGKLRLERKAHNNENILESDLSKGINEDILSISLNNENEEIINVNNKKILVFIKNDILKEKTIMKIQKNGGYIIESFQEDNAEILVYQPHSDFDLVVNQAKALNIQVFTVGKFNKILTAL